MTDPRDLDGGAEPNIKHEQEVHPPKRYDDPDAVAEEEKRYGMSIWVGTALIALIFVIIFLWIYLD